MGGRRATPAAAAVPPGPGIRWHLRQIMATRGMFSTTDLIPGLTERGIELSREQVYRLVTRVPERLNTRVLAALCDLLECTVGELIEPITTRSDAGPLNSPATVPPARPRRANRKAAIMVARTTVTIYDDLDNTEGASTVSFAYRGTSYEIDLGTKNQAALDKALAKFIAAARKKADPAPSSPVGRGRSKAKTKARTDLLAIRTWAQEQGLEISDRGRIPGEIQQAYDTAH
jgi:DNA-binding Xre family transcriptional regulator